MIYHLSLFGKEVKPLRAHLHPGDALSRQVRVDGGELATEGLVVDDPFDGSSNVFYALPQILGAVKSIDSTENLGLAIKKIIHYDTLRGKFSSVHSDLAAEDITRVEVGEEGLHFVTKVRAQQI